MSLVRSLNAGVSGMKSFQTKMDTIGNNIANVETAGFKSSRVTFAEMINQKLGRSGGGGDSSPQQNNEVGLGVRIASIDRNFTQGALNSTGVGTDLAIEGEGFFLVDNDGENVMTRAGNFVFNKEGHLVDQGGRGVQGFNADDDGNILGGGTTNDIRVDFDNSLPPQQTESVTVAGNLNADTSVSQVLQAQSGFTTNDGDVADLTTDLNDLDQKTGADPLVAGDTIDFDVTLNDGTAAGFTAFDYDNDGTTLEDLVDHYNDELGDEGTLELVDGMLILRSDQLGDSDLQITDVTFTDADAADADMSFPSFNVAQEGATNNQTMSTTIYDNMGRAHSVVLELTQTDTNTWEYAARALDGQNIDDNGTGEITFDDQGQLTSDSSLNFTLEPGNGANDVTFDINLGDTDAGTSFSQYAGSNTAKAVKQDGYAQGELVDVSIDGDGRVEGIYDNGNSMVLAQLALATVQNENGLEMIGGGRFRATSAAGEVFVNTAENIAETSVTSESLEGSNVDLAQEFTDMITAQRAYQSNSRVISTSDEMLMEAVNLKR